MLRLLFEAQTVQNFSVKSEDGEEVGGVGVGVAESVVPSMPTAVPSATGVGGVGDAGGGGAGCARRRGSIDIVKQARRECGVEEGAM